MNVNKVTNFENLISVRHSLNRHDMQSLQYKINTGDSYILHFRYVQYISPDCQKDVNKKDTSKWQLLIHTRNSTLTSQNAYHHQLEIHIMVLTCFIPLPAQTETHMKSTLSQRVLVVCVYIASLLSLSLTRAIFRPPVRGPPKGRN